MKLARLLTLVASAVALALPLAPAHAANVTKSYVAGFVGDIDSVCDDGTVGSRTKTNVGGVCFRNVPTGHVRLTVDDDVDASEVGYFAVFVDADGTCVGQGPGPLDDCPNGNAYCSPITLTIPSGAKDLLVLLDGANGLIDCENSVPGSATTGRVTASFS